MWRQPKTVWSVAFACVIAFMGIGLVDPILKPIADELGAAPSQVSLLFTSYMAVMGLAMLVTGWVSSRARRQAHPAARPRHHHRRRRAWPGRQDTVGGIVAFRAVWGLGNALFIATALATIVSAAARLGRRRRSSSTRPPSASASPPARCSAAGSAASRGAGRSSASPPSWRSPSSRPSLHCCRRTPPAGAAPPRSRAAARPAPPRPAHRRRSPRCSTTSASSRCWPSRRSRSRMGAHQIGLIFFGWGVLLAFTSVVVAPRLQRRFGTLPGVVGALARLRRHPRGDGDLDRRTRPVLVVGVVVAGAFLGVNNTLITETVMKVVAGRARASPPRPTASSGSAAAPSPRGWPASSARTVDPRAVLGRRRRRRCSPSSSCSPPGATVIAHIDAAPGHGASASQERASRPRPSPSATPDRDADGRLTGPRRRALGWASCSTRITRDAVRHPPQGGRVAAGHRRGRRRRHLRAEVPRRRAGAQGPRRRGPRRRARPGARDPRAARLAVVDLRRADRQVRGRRGGPGPAHREHRAQPR